MELLPKEEEFSMEIRAEPPSHYLYKIESFSMLSEHAIDKCESQEFETGGHTWKLVLYSDGNKKHDGEGYISAYMAIVNQPADSDVNVVFTFFIYNQILGNYTSFRGKCRRYHILKTEWGMHKLMSHNEFKEASNGYLVDDNCAFGVEVFVVKNSGLGECLSFNSSSFKHEWKISQFSPLTKDWISEEFSVGGRQWQVVLHPQGNISPLNHIFVYLRLVGDSPKKVMAAFKFSIIMNHKHYPKGDGTSFNWYSARVPSRGYADFLPLSEFLIEDCWILAVEVTVKAVVRDLP